MFYIFIFIVALAILVWEHWQFMTAEERFEIVNNVENKLSTLHSRFREKVWYKYWEEKTNEHS